MKEAIGGTWLFTLVIAFLAVFTTFVSVTTNYSRTYKIKDEIVMDLEYYNGVNQESLKAINNYIKGIGYTSTNKCPDDGGKWMGFSVKKESEGGYDIACTSNANYCIKKTLTSSCKIYSPRAYYTVVVFFQLNWPVLRQAFHVDISGETSTLRSYVNDCSGNRHINNLKEQLHCDCKGG